MENKGNGHGQTAVLEKKEKRPRFTATQLVVLDAWLRDFTSGKTGWFGKVLDPATGKRYQITAAVLIDGR